MKNKEAIELIIQKSKDNTKKYKIMSNLKTSKCILTEALKDTLSMAFYLEDSLNKKGYIMSLLMKETLSK